MRPRYLLRIRYFFFVVLFLFQLPWLSAQTDKELDVLNTYVDFMNECVHGLTVAQIIFVNYNQDLNNYVDLASHKLNSHITNKEMGASIFDNPDINTQDDKVSALKLSEITKQKSGALDRKVAFSLNEFVSQIVGNLNKLNALRFEVENVISSSDLTQKENVYKAYEMLEKAAVYFENYSHLHDQLARTLRRQVKYKYRPMDNIFFEIHSASLLLLKELSKENYSKLPNLLRRMRGALDNFSSQNLALSAADKGTAADFSKQVDGMLNFVSKTKDAAAIPQNFEQYGKNYYIHNHSLLSYFNSISPGFVSKMNSMLEASNESSLQYDDRPIMFKVIYPEKMEEIESIATKNVINSDAYPLDLKLKMDEGEKKTLPVPVDPYLELVIYDPNMKDRDTISLTVNGEKLLEGYELDFTEKEFKLPAEGVSTFNIELKAHNTGIIAPNTIGFKYRSSGLGKMTKSVIRLNEGEVYQKKMIIGSGSSPDSN